MKRRHIQIKIWPELQGFMPAIIPYETRDTGKNNPLDIDLSTVEAVQSSSLTIVVIDLIKLIEEKENRTWYLKKPDNNDICDLLEKLGLFDILQEKLPNQTSLWQDSAYTNASNKCVSRIEDKTVNHKITFPIRKFDFSSSNNKRDLVEEFRIWLFAELSFLNETYSFKAHKLIQILTEMAKNSGDHTDSNAFFGLDIAIEPQKVLIQFCFGDLGDGINKNVRKMLNDSSLSKAGHLGLVDSYHFALTPGETTKKKSKINRGIGMTIIHDLSKDLGLNLSVFDAESRGILTKVDNISHGELRKNFYHLSKGNVGFYYYGEVEHKIVNV